jgi:hypothetical protein
MVGRIPKLGKSMLLIFLEVTVLLPNYSMIVLLSITVLCTSTKLLHNRMVPVHRCLLYVFSTDERLYSIYLYFSLRLGRNTNI